MAAAARCDDPAMAATRDLLRRFAAVAAVVIGCGAAAAPAALAQTGGGAAVRAWGGTIIRSLDPAPAPGLRAPFARSSTVTPFAAGPQWFGGRPDEQLSNETTFTRWAHPAAVGPIYARPTPDSPIVTRLHFYTEDDFPEVYLLLRAHWDDQGREWVKLRIPMRPNGRTGWVPRSDLGAFHLTHQQIVVDRAKLRLYLYDDGRRVWSAPVAVGKPSTPTPAGHFWIRERFKILDPNSGYWPYAFGTSDYSTLTDWPGGGVVGIHGPYYDPSAIPGRVSHGCIRLETWDDAWLAQHVGIGTPVLVR